MSVGRVDAARSDIDEAIKRDAAAGQGYALRAVIAVALNNNAAALADGRRAVELSPDSVAAKIALSYALQAGLQLEEARDTLLQAVAEQPGDALAWARLAELHLSLGDRKASNAAAQRAVALQPGLSRTQNVLGFAALSEIRVEAARDAFEQAIASDSADPLPRLGLGLAKIRSGQLEEGRRDVEAAVALDSNNALLRAYLGKAYFEERRGPLDAQQLRIANELDPLDPTAFLYDGIRLQTENRPVEALGQLEESIKLNDNRAVYRSRLLLDQDRAARSASQARVFNDLGFSGSGRNAATRSLTLDPSSASAHRFLSDSYSQVRRREISRVSELLQAQMLQDVNISPVQPSTSETTLNTVTGSGPSSVGFNEFTPLFERNAVQLNLAGVLGSNDTRSGEAVVSAVYDRVSISAGAYDYESDGWRDNNGLEQDIYNLFAQAALTPDLNLQFELRHRESTEGDLAFNFDPDNFLTNQTYERQLDTTRVGLRYSPAPSSDILVSHIYSKREDIQKDADFPTFDFQGKGEAEGYQTEAQFIYKQDAVNVIAGIAYSDIDLTQETSGYFCLPPFAPFCPPSLPFFPPLVDFAESLTGNIEHPHGYVYANISLSEGLVATLGASYDSYEQRLGPVRPLEKDSFNPKVGLQWAVNDALTLRAAGFRVLKPALLANRTLEPTQVAGFNQFFDDVNGTVSTRLGAGFDWMPVSNLTIGGEATMRELEEPIRDSVDGFYYEDRDERTHRLYAYWTPTSDMAVTGEVVYDRYRSDQRIPSDLPQRVRTVSVPVALRYFMPGGFYAGLGGTYVDQEVQRPSSSTLASGSDDFFLVDFAMGYRLPNRRGVISLEVKNAFDQSFNFQDDSYRGVADEPSTGPYFPERTILGQVIVNF